MTPENTRETKILEIGDHKVVVNTYVTGREMRSIEQTLMDKLEMKRKGGEEEITGFKGAMMADRQDMKIKAVVASVDGKTDNIVDAVLDLPNDKAEEIMKYVDELTEPKKTKADDKKS